MTRPSAGESTSAASAGAVRSGSRKNNATAAGRISSAMVTPSEPSVAATTAGTAARAMNGRPAGSIFTNATDRERRDDGARQESAAVRSDNSRGGLSGGRRQAADPQERFDAVLQ